MTGPRWTLVEELFVRALDEPTASRAQFVRREAGDDGELAKEVLSLLANVREDGALFHDVIGAEIVRLAESWTARSGERIGAYRLDEKLGEGGMGVVYAASRDDAQFRQSVAIKILRHGLGSPSAVARFRDERQILATLEHPNIVRLLDGGSTDDASPYIVMERVRGVSITEYATSREVGIRARVRLFADVCAAVHYAHERGVVHRDLKPSNILVDEADTPKLLDFSIARPIADAIAREAHTRPGALLFTPEYASPEQMRGEPTGIASDIYSLGAVLYELLAGRPPHAGTPFDVLRTVGRESPPPPSTVAAASRHELAGDLDAIVAQALHEEPARRYASAAAFGDDLRRHLAGEPVSARGPGLWYRARKAARRRRAPILAACAAVVASAVGVGAWHFARSRSAASDCAAASERLAGVWDDATRETLRKRFAAAHDPDIDAHWRDDIESDLDETAATWATQWDAACRAPDRTTDPLLYGQRLTCLENILIELHGRVAAVGDADVHRAWVVGAQGRDLADCENTAVLRGQVPAPPPAVRARVSDLLVAAYRAKLDANFGESFRDAGGFAAATGKLDAIARELESLHPPAAAVPIMLRMELLADNTWDVASRLPATRAAIADALMRIAATRDDFMLASAETQEAWFELDLERDGDRIARGEAAIMRAAAALERAGSPAGLSFELKLVRALLAQARGDDAGAVAIYREAVASDPTPRPKKKGIPPSVMYALAAAEAGDTHAANTEIQRWRIEQIASLRGDEDPWLHFTISMVLEREGDLAGALVERRRGTALQSQGSDSPPHAHAWATIYEAELARRAGETNDHELLAKVHALASRGTTPPHQSPDGISTARRAGLYAVFARATELEADTGDDAALDAAAWLAFARGDDTDLARRTAAATARCAHASCDDWIRMARWLAILVDAHAGRTNDLEARLDALEHAYGDDHQAVANSGVVLASLGRWDAARVRLARARAMPNVWERQSDLVEVDTWLGLAQVRAGELASARASFEEALLALEGPRNGIEGFSYMTPVAQLALAQLLPETDRARARRLALRAREGFARLGPHRGQDREAAIRWLSDHPDLVGGDR